MSAIINKEGFSYSFDPKACESCEGRCCSGESGFIYVSKSEIEAISKLLEMDTKEFIDNYLFKRNYKYSIRERKVGESHECVFFNAKENGCIIYEARPTQCRTFPFWDHYKTRVDELKMECPGILEEETTNV